MERGFAEIRREVALWYREWEGPRCCARAGLVPARGDLDAEQNGAVHAEESEAEPTAASGPSPDAALGMGARPEQACSAVEPRAGKGARKEPETAHEESSLITNAVFMVTKKNCL